MTVLVDNRSGTPIYEQIYSQMKAQILSGEIKADEPLPSIRNLAKDLRISVITTKRAYDELENEGFIVTVPGKGSFACEGNRELVREEHLRELEEHLRQVSRLAALCSVSDVEVLEIYKLVKEEQ